MAFDSQGERGRSLTKMDLARRCNVSHTAMYKWFDGGVDDVSARACAIISRELGVSCEWLGAGLGNMTCNHSAADPGLADAACDLERLRSTLTAQDWAHLCAIIKTFALKSGGNVR